MHSRPFQKINIAIDGYSGCGKSTLARDLANCLNYIYLDSGAMYRAVTLYFLREGLDYSNPDVLKKALKNIRISFDQSGGNPVLLLNGKAVDRDIRSVEVNSEVSQIAKISKIRRFLVEKQQRIAESKGVIMEGRDIGTVVLPKAEYKLFLTADTDTRTERRYQQLKEAGSEVEREKIRANLRERDQIDSNRKDSPLRRAKDARRLDNTRLSRKGQLIEVLRDIKGRFPFLEMKCEIEDSQPKD
jgi:CMP/dCMP kinase